MTLLHPHRPSPPLSPSGEPFWRIETAERVGLIIDGAAFFAAAKQAMLRARRQILVIGWDFDPRIELERPNRTPGWPNVLGDLLVALVEARPELSVHVLRWQMPIPFGLRRAEMPLRLQDWLTSDRVQYRLDGNHPPGAAHHQKILVMDDAVAFVGGIDFAGNRWDTPAHADDEPRRTEPLGGRYEARHDVAMAVDGDAARALGDLARRRWREATGDELERPPPGNDAWPSALEAECCDIPVGIARTEPSWRGAPSVREVEALFLGMIAGTRHHLYIESQYLASKLIAQALEARLCQPDAPEVVVVLPNESPSFVEHAFMDGPRALILRRLSRFPRFRAYHPVSAGGQRIVVHSKLMIADGRILRIGSANLSNRSMGFDSECDLAIVADTPEQDNDRAVIRRFLHRLLADHLGVATAVVGAAMRRHGLIGAIERLRTRNGKTLVRLHPHPLNPAMRLFARYHLMDPFGRTDAWAPWGRRPGGRRALVRLLTAAAVAGGAVGLGVWAARRIERGRRIG